MHSDDVICTYTNNLLLLYEKSLRSNARAQKPNRRKILFAFIPNLADILKTLRANKIPVTNELLNESKSKISE